MSNIDTIIKVIREQRSILSAMANIKFDYTPQSLRKLEEALNSMFPFGREVSPSVAILLGTYLGEVIIKHIKGAKWVDFDDNPFDAMITIKNNEGSIELKPLIRVNKFINHDRTDGLYPFYAMAQDMAAGRVSMGGDNKWKTTPRGYKMRGIKLTPEQVEVVRSEGLTYEEIAERLENGKI